MYPWHYPISYCIRNHNHTFKQDPRHLTIAAQKTIFMSDAAYSTVLASHHRYFIAHSLIYISLIHKNGSKWVLSGHTISPCGSVLKNGSKWVLSGHTISPCATGPSHLRIRTEVNQNAKFLSYSKMALNGYFLGTQSHHAALRKLNFAEKKNVISLQHRRQYLCQMQPIALS